MCSSFHRLIVALLSESGLFEFCCHQMIFCIFLSQGDLLDIPAIAQLEKDDKYASVYQLLNIFLTKRLDAYLSFHSSDSNLLNSYGMHTFTSFIL